MKTNPIVWFEIYVNDMSRAQKFYETVFAITLSELPTPDTVDNSMKMVAFPQNMEGFGAGGALVKMDGFGAGNNSTIVYFGSEDCALEESKIENAGGTIFKQKQSLGEFGFMVLANDTEGNMIGIHSMK